MTIHEGKFTPKEAIVVANCSHVTVDWLKAQEFKLDGSVYGKPTIEGTYLREYNDLVDGRGDLVELWSLPWTHEEGGPIVPDHVYASRTDPGVSKAWHLHEVHVDQFAIIDGKFQVVLVDLRPDSPTFRKINSLIMGFQKPRMLKIPPGVMHGWKNLDDRLGTVINLQSHVYDGKDEIKIDFDTVLTDIWEPKNG